jgi:hypothetical protein
VTDRSKNKSKSLIDLHYYDHLRINRRHNHLNTRNACRNIGVGDGILSVISGFRAGVSLIQASDLNLARILTIRQRNVGSAVAAK